MRARAPYVRHAVAALAVALLAAPAAAQVNTTVPNQVVKSPGWTFNFEHPTQAADGGVIDCVYGADTTTTCLPFSRAACDPAFVDRPIQISVLAAAPVSPPTSSSVQATVWLQRNSNVCYYDTRETTTDDTVKLLATTPGYLPSNSTFLVGTGSTTGTGAIAFTMPDSTTLATFTMRDIINAFADVCASPGVNLTPFKLCMGSDNNGDGIIGTPQSGATTAGDPNLFFQFPVDTQAPPAPAIAKTLSLVSRVTVTVSYDTSGNDVATIEVLATRDPNSLQVADCTTWQGLISRQVQVAYTGTGTVSIDVPGDNGVEYAFCARAYDYLGNVGPPGAQIFFDEPHPECDFFGCYPEPLQVGYCGAGPGADGAAALAAAALLLRRRRRPGPIRPSCR